MDERATRHGRPNVAAIALLTLVGTFVVGWGLINIVDALESDEACIPYGTGGYGCPVDWSIDVEPSTDLVDRQTVQLRGEGFSPNTSFGAAQCDPTVASDVRTDACDLSTARTTTTDGDGDVELELVVRRIITVQGREIDCALSPCTVGAATLSGTTPIEATSVPVSFDPSVPPVPRLEVSLSVDDVTTAEATGTVTCNRSAEAFLDVVVQQTTGGSQSTAYGFADVPVACGVAPSQWTVRFTGGEGVLRGGPATYQAFASAFDGFDSASVQQAGEVSLSRGRPTFEPIDRPGETVSVEVVETTTVDGLAVSLLVDCDRAVPDGAAFVTVTQRAGLDTVTGFGFAAFGPCDGPTAVSVPITVQGGRLAGGPAEVRAEVQIADLDPPDEEFFDYASTTAAVRLQGSVGSDPIPVEPNPSSRLVITGTTSSALSGTVTCEEPALVDLFVEVQQPRGRTSSVGYGYVLIECVGTTEFAVPLEGDLRSGNAAVFVYATGYREIEGGDEYLWDDHQAATLRIRG